MKLKTVTLKGLYGSIKVINNVEAVYRLNGQNVTVVRDNNGGETYYNDFKLIKETTQDGIIKNGGIKKMIEYKIILQGGTLYISKPYNKSNNKVMIEHITDLIAYKVEINSTIKDLHDNYKIDETDTFYRLIIETVDHYNDITLIYDDINNILQDYNTIKQHML